MYVKNVNKFMTIICNMITNSTTSLSHTECNKKIQVDNQRVC